MGKYKYLPGASIGFFFIAFVLVFLPTWMSLITRWNEMDKGYSHGYLVLILCIYYIVQQIRRIDFKTVKTNYNIVPGLIVCSLLWSLSYHAHIEVIHQVLLPVMLLLFFVLILGLRASQPFVFPVFLLFFAIPFWDYLTVPLQNITVFVNGVLLDFIGIPAYIEGVLVTIPSGVFEVAGGCSGLRYLIVASILAVLYAYQHYTKWRSRIVLLLTAVFFAFFANWMRVYIIIIVGHVTEMQSDLIHNHEFFGWGLFAVTLIPLFYFAGRYSVWFNDEGPEVEIPTTIKVTQYKFTPYLIAFLATFTLPLFISPATGESNLAQAEPVFIGNPEEKLMQWIHPVFNGADVVLDETFDVNNGMLQVSIRRYAQQWPGKELIYYSNYIYLNTWDVTPQESESDFSFVELSHHDSEQNLLVASQYSIAGFKVNNPTYAKLLELLKPLMSSQISSVLILATACEATCDSAKYRIDSFISNNKDVIKSF